MLVEHGQLVTKGENLSLQGGAGPKTGCEEREKSNQNRVHRGRNHPLTNDGNLCVFKSDGVFGGHTGLRTGCGVRSQVTDVLEAQIKEDQHMKKCCAVCSPRPC